jgi:hypothetical protein
MSFSIYWKNKTNKFHMKSIKIYHSLNILFTFISSKDVVNTILKEYSRQNLLSWWKIKRKFKKKQR